MEGGREHAVREVALRSIEPSLAKGGVCDGGGGGEEERAWLLGNYCAGLCGLRDVRVGGERRCRGGGSTQSSDSDFEAYT